MSTAALYSSQLFLLHETRFPSVKFDFNQECVQKERDIYFFCVKTCKTCQETNPFAGCRQSQRQ